MPKSTAKFYIYFQPEIEGVDWRVWTRDSVRSYSSRNRCRTQAEVLGSAFAAAYWPDGVAIALVQIDVPRAEIHIGGDEDFTIWYL